MGTDKPLRVAMIASEAAPLAKTGGLGDAVAGLARALAAAGVEVLLFLPDYGSIGGVDLQALDVDLEVPVDGGSIRATAWCAPLAQNLNLYLIDIPQLFDRPGVYGDEGGLYADNARRFSAFNRAAIALLRALDLPCDVLHAHDWQAALAPLLLRAELREDPPLVLPIQRVGLMTSFEKNLKK